MSELANDLGLTRSSATELVDRLGRRSWVRRGADPADRRTSRVTLTTAGAAIAEHAHASVTERLGGATARLATAERRALTDAIGRRARVPGCASSPRLSRSAERRGLPGAILMRHGHPPAARGRPPLRLRPG